MGNLMIAMSGGTTTVINATLAGIVEEARRLGFPGRVYAGVHGLHGVMAEDILDLTGVSNETLRLLATTPASGFAGTARLKPLDEAEMSRIADVFAAHEIDAFLNIGGNGTIRQSMSVSERLNGQVQVLALPKTVDNDFGDSAFEAMFFTPGFPSIVNYWSHKVNILNQENEGACQHDRVLVAMTFGRETGFIAGSARLSDPGRELPMLILLPEDQRGPDDVLAAIENLTRKRGRALVVVCHGYRVDDVGARYDPSGQVMYGSSRNNAAQLLTNLCNDHGMQARLFVPEVDQRDEILLTCDTDIELSRKLGRAAAQAVVEGSFNGLVSVPRQERIYADSHLRFTPFDQTTGFSRRMPAEWVGWGRFDVSDAYLSYLTMVMAEMRCAFLKDGRLPRFARRPTRRVEKRLAAWEGEECLEPLGAGMAAS